ncbi:MAG: ribonuclease HI [bacterium]
MEKVTIYTDGACSGNPGPGGWAAILISGPRQKEISGFSERTTNNRMELIAVIEALKALKKPCEVTVYSDSAYLINCFQQGWLEQWKRNGWRKGKNKNEQVLNLDLWQELDRLMQPHRLQWLKVPGHAGVHYNERVDALATQQIRDARN